MEYSRRKWNIAWLAVTLLLMLILVISEMSGSFRQTLSKESEPIQWILCNGEKETPVGFPCKIPTGSGDSYRFIARFNANPEEDMSLGFYQEGQKISVRVNGQLRNFYQNQGKQNRYEIISLGHLSGDVRLELGLCNQNTILFGHVKDIVLTSVNMVSRTVTGRIAAELILGILMFLAGFVGLLLNKIYYKTARESYSVSYISWFVVMFSVLCILRTHFFDMIIGLSPVWYFLENFLLLLLPQFLLMACEVISYPNIFYMEYQGFNFIYRIYFVLAVGLTVFGQCTLSDMAVWSILYMCVFFLYIGAFGFFETKIISRFDHNKVVLHSSLLKTIKTAIALYGCVVALNLASRRLYWLFLISAYFAVAVFFAEIFNQIKTLERLKEEINQSKVSLLLSQIKPHFLYNTLNSIRTLIRIQPEQADYMVYDFSRFLKANMNTLDKTMIHFSQEYEHLQFYVNIEKTCFPKLNVEYQVETQDFYVPSLTIQPLMENAIKHGVLKRVEGGTVRLRTSQDDNFWYVEIEDNGVGFASEGPEGESPDGHSGIGICNIERRLEYYCNAAFFIHSVPGQGTFVRISIPKKGQHHGD